MTRAILGREQWTSRLRSEVDRTVTGHGGLVLITGEAGIGKTTLVGTVVQRAREAGALVAVGTCSSSSAAPQLWPWTQVMRALQRAGNASDLAAAMTEAGLEISDLMAPPTDSAQDAPGDRRFAMAEATAGLLSSISHRVPVVIVVEDLHWADAESVELLDFVARHCWFERVLLVATYRDTEVGTPEHPLHRAIADLSPQAGTIQVTGLDLDSVAGLVQQVSGRTPPATFVADLHRRTGGNPFFVEQTARLWVTGQGDDALAPGVTEAVRRRLAPLPRSATDLLAAAAIIDAEPTFPVLSAVSGLPQTDAAAGLAAALAARLLQTGTEGTYTFVHDLVRETVLADLDPEVTRRLHAAVVAALEQHPDAVLPGEAADHALCAGDLVQPDVTVDLLIAAGRDANARMSTSEAIAHYRRAAELIPPGDRQLLIRLDLAGEMYFEAALHQRPTGEAAAMVEELVVAAEHASPITAARVAIEAIGYPDVGSARATELLRTHAATLLEGPVPQRRADLLEAVTDALADAARAGADDETLASVLTTRHMALWRPGTSAERRTLMSELQVVARRHGDRDSEQFASSMLWVTMLEQSDPAYLEQFRAFVSLTAQYRSPRFVVGAHVDEAVVAAFRGDLTEAFEHLATIEEEIPAEDLYWWLIRYLHWALALRRGDHESARGYAAELARSDLDHTIISAAQAAEDGRFEQAHRLLGEVNPPAELDGSLTMPLAGLHARAQALTAAGTGDPELIAAAREQLRPLSGTWSVDMHGVDLAGPIDLYLGQVEARAGDTATARCHLECAVRAADRMATPYWATAARLALLEVLDADDPRRAELQAAVVRALQHLEVPLLQRQAERLGLGEPSVPRPDPTPAAATADSTNGAGEFRRQGQVWQVGLAGTVVAVPDAKGLRDLHTLLANPGVDISSTDLVNPNGDPQVQAATRQGGDPILDDTAREQYRARLASLDDELDAAGSAGHTERRDELLAEREALIAELRAATGLGGRARRLGDQSERARKTVTARIRDSLRRLDEAHPGVAAHLRATVSTGSSCRYSPSDPPVEWRLS